MSNKNKMRLYLAYWRRQAKLDEGISYHVGLILSPKDPENNEDKVAMIYHAINRVIKLKHKAIEAWIFESKLSVPRTERLAGCMLLGKVSSTLEVDDITRILSTVHVPDQKEAEERNWRCSHWVLDALTLLEEKGIIPKLVDSPENTWRTGKAFVNELTGGNLNHNEPLYTCDTSGKKIGSEIPALD